MPGEIAQAIWPTGTGVDLRGDCFTIGAHAAVAVDVPLHGVVIESVKLNPRSRIDTQQIWIDNRHRNVCNRSARLTRVDETRLDACRQRRGSAIDGQWSN